MWRPALTGDRDDGRLWTRLWGHWPLDELSGGTRNMLRNTVNPAVAFLPRGVANHLPAGLSYGQDLALGADGKHTLIPGSEPLILARPNRSMPWNMGASAPPTGVTTRSFTVAIWVLVRDIPVAPSNVFRSIWSQYNAPAGKRVVGLFLGDGAQATIPAQFGFLISTNGTTSATAISATITAFPAQYFVACRYDGVRQKMGLSINGGNYIETSGVTGVFNNDAITEFNLGAAHTAGSFGAYVTASDLMIWRDRALSQRHTTLLWNQGRPLVPRISWPRLGA